jgi:hypothetical protein
MEFKYLIGEKVYIQRPLVLGQIRQLLDVLKGLMIPKDINAFNMIDVFGDKLSGIFAIVLTPEGMQLKDKPLDELSREIEFSIEPEMSIEVVGNFFELNPIAYLLERLSGVMLTITGKMTKTGSKNSSASSPEAISPNVIQSSGDSPSENASLISSSDREK